MKIQTRYENKLKNNTITPRYKALTAKALI